MVAMRERTRRFWTSTLFVLLGPTALCLAAICLYWQTTPKALNLASARISQRLRYDVSLERHETLLPGVERLVNVEIRSQNTDESLLFCPEIYKLQISDVKLLSAFSLSLDRRGRVENDETVDLDQAVAGADWRDLSDEEDAPSVEPLSDFVRNNLQSRNYSVVVAPRILYRGSQASELTDALSDRLLRTVSESAASSDATAVLCVVSDEIQLLSDEEYQTSLENASFQKTCLTKQELLSSFRTAVYLIPRGEVGTSEASTRDETLAFSSESPRLVKFRALHINAPTTARTEALFELQKISSSVPYYAAVQRDKTNGSTRFEYDSTYAATPGSLAAAFIPSFSVLESRGWFTGRVVTRTAKSEGAQITDAQLEDVHLCNCELEELCNRFDLPSFTGNVSDLSIERGHIRQGVFRGNGSIKVSDGSIPVKVAQRLNAMHMLEASPQQALQLRFINDATPFNELELQFSFDEDGVMLDSNYRNKIVAFYEKGSVKYGLFLPETSAGRRTSYAQSLSALFESQDDQSFWNPLVRNALNHLPVQSTASARGNDSLIR